MTRIDDESGLGWSEMAPDNSSAPPQMPAPTSPQQDQPEGNTNDIDDTDNTGDTDNTDDTDDTGDEYPIPLSSDTSRARASAPLLDRIIKYPWGWGKKDVLIAVMGMTGSGKTTFISKVTGRTNLKIGHDLTSCTQKIEIVKTKINGQTVRFIDTPGFSDTYLSDAEVLQMIAEHLNDAYSLDMRLSGIIYLHPISDNRFTHHATKNLDMFRKLTGEGNLKNVILATTMWGKVTIEEGERREQELKSKFWDVLLAYQATYSRYDGSPRSAKDIASKLLSNNTPFYAQLQEEMGRQKLAIKDTAAGKEVMSEILRMREEHQKQLEEMKILMLRTAAEENKVALAALEQHYKEMLKAMEKVHKDEKMMNENKIRSLTERISQLESRRGGGGGGGSSCVIL